MITTYTLVQIISLAIYAILATIVLGYGKTRYKKAFILLLTVSIFWSFVSFKANQPLPLEQAILWGKMVTVFALGTAVAYSYFIAVYTHNQKFIRVTAWAGLAFLAFLTGLVILGLVPKEYILLNNGIVRKEYGEWYYFISLGGFFFLFTALYLLWKKRCMTTDHEERNRVSYLFLGICLLLAFGIIFKIIPAQNFAVDHVGHLANAIIITYAVIRHNLIDIKLVIKKGIVLAGISSFIFVAFVILFYGLNRVLEPHLSNTANIAITIVAALGFAALFNPLRVGLERGADHLLYGSRYDYRQMVLSFADRMSHVIELPELAEAMLRPITKAVSASQASLLFAADGHYRTCFAERLTPREPAVSVSLREEGPIVNWLKQENTPLYQASMLNLPEFKALWQEERNSLEAAQIELLCPIESKHKLIAILALSKKLPRGIYQQDDIDLLMTMCHEAAVVIENAQLYAKAKERANSDELTGLYNHRYFHERVEEEIARCSRFGDIFSLIFLDIDMFKNYNDVCGHLAGDEAIKQVGMLIQSAMRKVDIGFRYGGDEFSILLPHTTLNGAHRLAERLRKQMEAMTSLRGAPLTFSAGISSWPTDGVMREEIIQSVDAALYYAKQTGKNRTCLACEVALSDVQMIKSRFKQHAKKTILSTIYALAATVDAKDSYTYGHSKKVSQYAADIAEALGYSRDEIERIRAAALLHDIGKIGISDRILSKPGPLSIEEFKPIRAHPNLGVSILKHIDSLKGCLAAVQYHHERYDGKGYPTGLKGSNIPLDARILAVADAYDAMTSERPYRLKKATPAQAIAELQQCSGSQFDPEIVTLFVDMIRGEKQADKAPEKVSK